ncbi:hypothetical protein D3C86_1805680 [compost metagenome]
MVAPIGGFLMSAVPRCDTEPVTSLILEVPYATTTTWSSAPSISSSSTVIGSTFLRNTSFCLNPIKEKTSVCRSSISFIVNSPCAFVIALLLDPLTLTVAPGSGLPLVSVTRPFSSFTGTIASWPVMPGYPGIP